MCNAESVVEVENVGLQLAGKENQKKRKYSNDTKDQKNILPRVRYPNITDPP